jgi:hypothetical protein
MHLFGIRPARAPADIASAAALFEEYAAGLGVDLSYQGFPAELPACPAPTRRPRESSCWLGAREAKRWVASRFGRSRARVCAR